MPDLKDGRDARTRAEETAADALRLVARDDAETAVPVGIETAVMRAWDARSEEIVQPRSRLLRPAWAALAAAACAVLVAALWLTDAREGASSVARTPASSAADPPPADIASSLESIAPIDVLLQEDPSSLQVVRLSVQPSVLTALGYPLADPTDTQPFAVDVLVGLDGVPRAIRRVDTILNRE